jgi:hypothetical protein
VHALFIEVNADESKAELHRESIERGAVPRLRDAGASAGYWLNAQDGRAVAVVLFDSEEAAKRAAEPLRVGEAPLGAPAGTTFRTVEIREVLTSL